MGIILEKEISQDTMDQVYAIAKDYTRDFFTAGFPADLRIDMQFQQALLLKDGAEILSCIIFTSIEGSPHITMMATKRAHCQKGYGKQLMQHFESYLDGLGLKSIELLTFSPSSKPEYSSTVGFYKDAGFRVISEYVSLWIPGVTTIKMRKSW